MVTTTTKTTTTTNPDQLARAVTEYLSRQSRERHPSGTWDRAGRWCPTDAEWQDCCGAVRSPSAAYPLSLQRHCRSVEHVAALHAVDARELRRAARLRKQDGANPEGKREER